MNTALLPLAFTVTDDNRIIVTCVHVVPMLLKQFVYMYIHDRTDLKGCFFDCIRSIIMSLPKGGEGAFNYTA